MGVAVGNVGMTEDQLISNIMLAINYLVSLLKKGMAKRGELDDQGFYVSSQAPVLEGQRRCNLSAKGAV